MSEPTSGLFLTSGELCSTIHALRNAMGRRVFWALTPGHPFRTYPLEDVQKVLDTMAQSYAKALMLARDDPGVAPSFLESFKLHDEVWETIDLIGSAGVWDEIFTHQHRTRKCVLCDELRDLL